MHKKDRLPDQLKDFLCNSPVYDENLDEEIANRKSPFNFELLDENRPFQDEGIFPPKKGTYHIYHRLDGKLVAVGVLDLLNRYVNSGYFIYDPDYKFLNLGVLGALRELEYIRLVKSVNPEKYNWYQLGDMAPICNKVNYKLSYKPGTILCPRTKKPLLYDDVKDKIEMLPSYPITEK